MAEELMLKVEDVYKKYRLGTIGGGTLTADLQSWWAGVRHKEDPNSKIGAKTYGKNEVFYALNGISFEVRKGEALGIIGGNGAGKSTTLKLISQVTAPTKGKIYLNGRITSMLEVGTGFHPELTGRENIYLNGAILGMTKAEIDNKIEEIIDFSECRQFIDTPVKRYSSGMYVKLAFSVAAHLDSEIMIMDEVLAVGDMAFQNKCIDKMKHIANDEGRTILYVSHNMNTIRQLCDRCIVLNRGRVIFEGDVEEAIKVYMGMDLKNDFPIHYNLGIIERIYDFGMQLLLKDFIYLNKERAIYQENESIFFAIKVDSSVDVEGVQVLLTVKDNNYNKIGAGISRSFDVKVGQNQEFRFKFNHGCLAEGTYCFGVAVVKFKENGEHFAFDDSGEKILFKLNAKNMNGVVWHENYWGNVLLPEVELV